MRSSTLDILIAIDTIATRAFIHDSSNCCAKTAVTSTSQTSTKNQRLNGQNAAGRRGSVLYTSVLKRPTRLANDWQTLLRCRKTGGPKHINPPGLNFQGGDFAPGELGARAVG